MSCCSSLPPFFYLCSASLMNIFIKLRISQRHVAMDMPDVGRLQSRCQELLHPDEVSFVHHVAGATSIPLVAASYVSRNLASGVTGLSTPAMMTPLMT